MMINRMPVPCNGCTRCCQMDAVRILPGDDINKYQVAPHPYMEGELMIDHKDNGDCIYMTRNGCSIHAFAPRICREMDCRILFYNLEEPSLDSMWRPIWERGMYLAFLDFARMHAEEYGKPPVM